MGLEPLPNAFITTTKRLVNLLDKLTSEFHFPPVFSSLLQMITLQSWKEGRSKTDSFMREGESSYLPSYKVIAR